MKKEIEDFDFDGNDFLLFIYHLIEKVDEKVNELEPKLKEEIKDPKKLVKATEFQRASMLIQAVVKGSIAYLRERKIKIDACVSVCGSDIEDETKRGEPALIGNYALLYPETIDELDYHMSIMLTFLEAKAAGWKPGLYTLKELRESLAKAEQHAEEYEDFVVRGKL